jgi:hydrogenase maturation factor
MIGSGDLAPQCHPEIGCITCGDEGVEMTVLAVDAARALAVCADGAGMTSEVDLGIVDSAIEPGYALLVHAGVALTHLEPERTA